MKKVFRAAMLAAILTISCERPTSATPPSQATSSWLTDFKQAQQQAKQNHKLLLLDFTGSDWCGPCMLFNRNILSKPEFKDYADKNLVLMEVDFPRTKKQNAALEKQNEQLAMQHQVNGFPTVVVLNADGRKLWEFEGLFPGDSKTFIAVLEKLRKS